jgi:cellulose synthase/poly-beta-1,6-N-acetylglucosamine synthase-like glycosyltransferase
MIEEARIYVQGVNWIVLTYFAVIHTIYLFFLALSAVELRSYLRRLQYGSYDLLFKHPQTPAVTVLMPSYNESVNIATSVRGVLNLNYPTFEVIVINDGSTDETLAVLKKSFELIETERAMQAGIETASVKAIYRSLSVANLTVIDKANGGKSDSLNAGINASRTPYFCAVDADIILEEDALLRVMRPIIEDPEKVVAVGGIVRVANGCKVALGRIAEAQLPRAGLPMFQVVDYLRAFLGARTGLSRINGLLIISGAFGVFARKWATAVGGYRTDTVGEDMELVCAIHCQMREMKLDYRVVFIADPVCWTEVPSTFAVLSRQRRRWQRGLMEVLSHYRKMLFNRRYGVLGWFSYPFFYFFEGWGPIVEVLGYLSVLLSWMMGWISPPFAYAFLTLSVALGMLITLCSILLEELTFHRYPAWSDIARMMAYGLIENVSYRQLTTLYRCLGLWDFLRKKRGWGVMSRAGIGV